MTKDEIDALLNTTDQPNEPLSLKGKGGMSGKREIIKLDEFVVRRRKKMIGTMLVNGATRDHIVDTMSIEKDKKGNPIPGLPMSAREVDIAIRTIKAEWEEEESDEKRYAKIKARKRILSEIDDARQAGAYNALGNLEKVLMQIEGTAEPLEIQQPTDNRVTDAVLALLGEMDKVEVRMLVDQERERFALGDSTEKKLLPPATVSTAQIRKIGKKDI